VTTSGPPECKPGIAAIGGLYSRETRQAPELERLPFVNHGSRGSSGQPGL